MMNRKEKDILTQLHQAETHFSKAVSEDDFVQMMVNIDNDHPLFLHTIHDPDTPREVPDIRCVLTKVPSEDTLYNVVLQFPVGSPTSYIYVKMNEDMTVDHIKIAGRLFQEYDEIHHVLQYKLKSAVVIYRLKKIVKSMTLCESCELVI